MPSVSEPVYLRHGLVIPLAAIELALDLERRGCQLGVDGDGLLVGPPNLITSEDREAIRALKPHLIALIDYVEREANQ